VRPNSSSGNFYLAFDRDGEKTITVFDARGQLMMDKKIQEKEFLLNLDTLSNGLYIMAIQTDWGKTSKKLILNR
jgi:hypothetical protein